MPESGSDRVIDPLDEARADLAKWAAAGSNPWELPASAVHFALDCHGCESNPIGTAASLDALTDECEQCCGEGFFQDDSHPANPCVGCEWCRGHGRVPVRGVAKEDGPHA